MHILQRQPIDVESTLASLTLAEKISLLSGMLPLAYRSVNITHNPQDPTFGILKLYHLMASQQ